MKTTVDKQALEQVLNYLQQEKEKHYEETIENYGLESDEVQNHIYEVCRKLWCDIGQ